MPIDATLAQFSDWSFRSAFGVYLLAAVFLIAQYATLTVTASERKAEKQLVPAGKAPLRPTGPGRIE